MTARQEQGKNPRVLCSAPRLLQALTLCSAVGQLQPEESLALSNAQVDMFRSSMRLTIGPNGSVSKTEALDTVVNVSA